MDCGIARGFPIAGSPEERIDGRDVEASYTHYGPDGPDGLEADPRTGTRRRSGKEFLRQASLTAHWHDKGADWRGLAHTQAHHRSRLSDSVKNGNALRTMHNAALPAR